MLAFLYDVNPSERVGPSKRYWPFRKVSVPLNDAGWYKGALHSLECSRFTLSLSLPESPDSNMALINANEFYAEYHGHTVAHLSILHRHLGNRPRVFLAGDSSLDSKYWIRASEQTTPVNGYEKVLSRGGSRKDVCYWLNQELGPEYVAINCAVEESTLCERRARLLPQDEFIRDNIGPEDVLVISVSTVAVAPCSRGACNYGVRKLTLALASFSFLSIPSCCLWLLAVRWQRCGAATDRCNRLECFESSLSELD